MYFMHVETDNENLISCIHTDQLNRNTFMVY